MKNIKLLILLLIGFSVTGFAQQQGDYSKEPGYFDFGELLSLKSGDTITEVYLEEPLLKMVAQMGDAKQEGIGKALDGLKLVKVNEFMVDKSNIEKVDDVFASVDKNLQAKKWNRIIKTKHNDSVANVFVRNNGNKGFDGLVITSIDKKGKVTLVNIVGNIDLATIGKLSHQFHFPDVDKMKEKSKEKESE